MEAVPKLPMLSFSLKQSLQKTSFLNLKQYIAECYNEDPDTYSKEIYDLETLRAAAYNPSSDVTGCNIVKRYYCQLQSLQNRFPIADDRTLVNFSWRGIFSSNASQSSEIQHDMAAVLYNYGALHTQLGASVNRSSEEEMKVACTHFQCAAWAFETVREKYQASATGDLFPELLILMQQISFAQAQECILEKSLIDNRKSLIVAKVTAQIIEYYNAAFAALLTGGDEGIISEVIGAKVFKEWKQYIQFKVQYLSAILLLYQGQNAEEQQKMGERVILFQAAFDRLEEARKESKGLNNIQQVNEALTFVNDVIEAKRKAAKNENEFIYHEEVPELSSIATIQGANLVKGISFNVADPTITADDIFHRLVPLKTHETSSLYSEEKANRVRKIKQQIDEKNDELDKFMESLNTDSFNNDTNNAKLPQSLIDRCAALNAKPNAIPDLIEKMSSLAEICVDVENMLQNIQEMLKKEEYDEKNFEQTVGLRPSSHFTELNREYMKYQEAHNKASDSNDTLRRAMELHVNNLKILSKPLAEVQAAIPVCTAEKGVDAFTECRNLNKKVKEMRLQREQLMSQLNENIQNDDITTQLIAWGDKDVEKLFQTELAKHDKLISTIEQNLVAQGNILKAFTDAYAKSAYVIKTVADTKHKRDIFFSSLIASYDVYDDLLGKSLKGLEFYKKLQSSIHKLHARVRSARDVHEEERQQHLDTLSKKMAGMAVNESLPTIPSSIGEQDYMNVARKPMTYDITRNSSIRPTPIGQENTGIPSNCINSVGYNRNLGGGQQGLKSDMTSNQYAYVDQQATSSVSQSYTTLNPQSYYPARATSTVSSTVASVPQSTYSSQPQSVSYSNPNYANSGTGYVNPIYGNIPTSNPSPAPSPSQIYYNEQSAAPARANNQYAANQQFTTDMDSYSITGQTSKNVPSAIHPRQHPTYESSPNINYSSQSLQFTTNTNTISAGQELQPQLQYAQYQRPQQKQEIPTNSQASAFYTTHPNVVSGQQYQDTAYAKIDSSSKYPEPAHSYQSTITPNQYLPTDYSIQQVGYSQPNLQTNYAQHTNLNESLNTFNQPTNTSTYSNISYPQQHSQIDAQQHSLYNYSQSSSIDSTGTGVNSYTQAGLAVDYSTANAPTNTYYDPQYSQNTSNVQQYYNDPSLSQYSASTVDPNSYANPNTTSYLNAYGNSTTVPNVGYTTDLSNSQSYNYYNPTQYNAAVSQAVGGQVGNTTTISDTGNGAAMNQTNNYMPQSQNVNPNENPAATNFNTSRPEAQPPKTVQPQNTTADNKTKSRIDLLSELDNLPLPAPTLQPIKSNSVSGKTEASDNVPEATIKPMETKEPTESKSIESASLTTLDDSMDDVLENLAPLDVSMINSKENMSKSIDSLASDTPSTTSTASTAMISNSVNIEAFFKDVQRYEKAVNSLATKTLNGTTPLEIKWKELHDLLEKDANKRSISVSKLFPDKNRNMLSVPFDHARVILPKETDNYINAAHVVNLGPKNSHFILADAPASNTIKDFWCMIWSEKTKFVVCLYTTDEIQNLLFPRQLNVEQIFGEYSIKVLKEQNLSHAIQRQIQVTMLDTNLTREISIIQIKSWSSKSSTGNIIGISQNIIDATKATDGPVGPVILNCATNCERSSLIALTVTCILALNVETPVIINASDVWYRICSQRNCILNDINTLQLSMQIILNCCREFIKRRTLTAPANNTQSNYYFIEDEETTVKDPFKDLDPLWKLK